MGFSNQILINENAFQDSLQKQNKDFLEYIFFRLNFFFKYRKVFAVNIILKDEESSYIIHTCIHENCACEVKSFPITFHSFCFLIFKRVFIRLQKKNENKSTIMQSRVEHKNFQDLVRIGPQKQEAT